MANTFTHMKIQTLREAAMFGVLGRKKVHCSERQMESACHGNGRGSGDVAAVVGTDLLGNLSVSVYDGLLSMRLFRRDRAVGGLEAAWTSVRMSRTRQCPRHGQSCKGLPYGRVLAQPAPHDTKRLVAADDRLEASECRQQRPPAVGSIISDGRISGIGSHG